MLANKRSLAAEREYRTLIRAVEQSPVSIAITNPQGIIEYINPRFTRETGFGVAEAIGQSMKIVRSGQTPPETYRDLWQTIIAKRDWRGELLNRRKDDTLIWEEVSISPVLDAEGEIAHFIAVKEDITERKARGEALSHHNLVLEQEAQLRIRDLVTALADAEDAERKLRNSQSFVQGILDSVDSQIAVIDEQGTIVAINDAWRRFSIENSIHPGQLAPNTDVGANYLSICVAANAGDNDEGLATRDGIQAVLDARALSESTYTPRHQTSLHNTNLH
jgi:PAS domain S-box-containing protein